MTKERNDLPTATLANEHIKLTYLTQAGPRIMSLSLAHNHENILMVMPEKTVETEHGLYRFYGGHRLWHAPEIINRTYMPDNDELTIETSPHGVRLHQPQEEATAISKQIDIQLKPDSPQITIHHHLTNQGLWSIQLAPWAITQLRLGGQAICPQFTDTTDPDGLQPNRHLVLWPYTRWQDSRLHLHDDYIYIEGQAQLPACKIGYFNRHGWLAYQWQDLFFIKHFQPQPGSLHPDQGCNVEIYVNDEFIELETLGPLQVIQPNQTITHTETWQLYHRDNLPTEWQERLLSTNKSTL